MNTFSELLNFLVHQKDVPVYPMTQYCEIERTLMYRYLNGKSIPENRTTVERMADFMRLSPAEREQLVTAWRIQKTGPEKWHSRKCVENFLLHFPETAPAEPPASVSSIGPLPSVCPQCHPLFTHTALNLAVGQILMEEFKKTKGHLRLLLQPDYEYLFQSLKSMGEYTNTFSVEHILCLENSSSPELSSGSCNLTYLQKTLPLYSTGLDYHVYYYYDAVSSHFFNLNAFPCLILTDSFAITCTSDFQYGILYGDPEVIRLLTDSFEQCRQKCASLFYRISTVPQTANLISDIFSEDNPYFFLQAQPFIIPFLTPDLAEKIIPPDLNRRKELLQLLNQLTERHQQDIHRSHLRMYHTQNGIRHFLDTGKIAEMPGKFYTPFSWEDRLLLLYRISRHIPECCRILHDPLEKLPLNFHLCVSRSGGYLIFSGARGEPVYLRFTESGLVDCFMDYFENMEETSMFSDSDSRRYLESFLEQPEKL